MSRDRFQAHGHWGKVGPYILARSIAVNCKEVFSFASPFPSRRCRDGSGARFDRLAHRVRHRKTTPPSERITVGFIGSGKMANDYHLPSCSASPTSRRWPSARSTPNAASTPSKAWKAITPRTAGLQGLRRLQRLPRAHRPQGHRRRRASPRPSTGTPSRPSRPARRARTCTARSR